MYGYTTGVFSSRKLEQATYDSVAFCFVAANEHPDHDTLNIFRKRFLKEIEVLLVKRCIAAARRRPRTCCILSSRIIRIRTATSATVRSCFLLFLQQENMRMMINVNALTALALLIAESDPASKEWMIHLLGNLLISETT